MPTPWLGQAADPLGSAAERENVGLLHQAVHAFSHASSASRFDFLTALVRHCSVRELSQLEGAIVPRLKVDFLQRLPLEVERHVRKVCIQYARAYALAAGVPLGWRWLGTPGTFHGCRRRHERYTAGPTTLTTGRYGVRVAPCVFPPFLCHRCVLLDILTFRTELDPWRSLVGQVHVAKHGRRGP